MQAFSRALLLLQEPMTLDDLPARFISVLSLVAPGHFFHISLTKPGVGAVDAFMNLPAHRELLALAERRDELLAMPGVHDVAFYRRADKGPVSFYDLMSRPELERTVLWEAFCKPLDLVHDLSVNFFSSPRIFYTISTSRDTKPYTDGERALLALLQPHLAQRFHLLMLAQPSHPLAGMSGCPLDACWLLADGRGRVLRFGPGAERLLRALGVGACAALPAGWREWLAGCLKVAKFGGGAGTLAVSGPNAAATVYCVPNPAGGEHRLYLQKKQRSFASLTLREKEVAAWLAKGKTNPEIAVILGVKRATVKNHVESILAKLGCENRLGVGYALGGLA